MNHADSSDSDVTTWEAAVEKFLTPWRSKPEVTGALVCGSFVTGDPSPRSDIDLHVILMNGTPWRERGNSIVDGYMLEYFASTPEQIRAEYADDHRVNSWQAMVRFATGRVLFDNTGDIGRLKSQAGEWKAKPFKRLDQAQILEGMKYSLWDTCDNVRDAFERDAVDFAFVLHEGCASIFRMYSRYLGWHLPSTDQLYRLLTDGDFRARYKHPEFPDLAFVKGFRRIIHAADRQEMMRAFADLTNHVLERMGGFEIDGWRDNPLRQVSCRLSGRGLGWRGSAGGERSEPEVEPLSRRPHPLYGTTH